MSVEISIDQPKKLAKRFDPEYMKEYLRSYREKHPDYNKNYYEKHKEKMIRQITDKLTIKELCSCGKYINRGYMKNHLNTPLHHKLVRQQNI